MADGSTPTRSGKSNRGFASMSPERRSEIARKGGQALTPEQRSFSQDRDLAKRAGKRGGINAALAKSPTA